MSNDIIDQDEMPPELPMSEPARLAGVYFSPGKAFADIAVRPRFWAPLIIGMLLAFGYLYSVGHQIGWERVARQQLESNPRFLETPADQREQAVQLTMKILNIVSYVSPVVVIIFTLIMAGVLMLVFNAMLGARLRFVQVFAVVVYAGLARAIESILSIVMVYVKNPDQFDFQHPLAFNLGAFLPEGSSRALMSLASSIDLFTIWTIVLLAIGLQKAAGRMTFGKALAGVAVPWGLLVMIGVIIAIIRG